MIRVMMYICVLCIVCVNAKMFVHLFYVSLFAMNYTTSIQAWHGGLLWVRFRRVVNYQVRRGWLKFATL